MAGLELRGRSIGFGISLSLMAEWYSIIVEITLEWASILTSFSVIWERFKPCASASASSRVITVFENMTWACGGALAKLLKTLSFLDLSNHGRPLGVVSVPTGEGGFAF